MNDILDSGVGEVTADGTSFNALSSPNNNFTFYVSVNVPMNVNNSGTLNVGPLVGMDLWHNTKDCQQCGQMWANANQAGEALSKGLGIGVVTDTVGTIYTGAVAGAAKGGIGGAIEGGSEAATEAMGPVAIVGALGTATAEFWIFDMFTPAEYTPPNP
jgi:hypothetical protein